MYGDYYHSLNLAKLACIKDKHCMGVQDMGYTNPVAFRLCKKGFRKPHKQYIYEKQVAIGMNQLLHIIMGHFYSLHKISKFF